MLRQSCAAPLETLDWHRRLSQASAPAGAPAPPRQAPPAPGRAGAAAGGRGAPGGPGQPVECRVEPRARGARGRPPRRAQGLLLCQPLPRPPRRRRGRALPQLLPVRRAARRPGRGGTAGRALQEPDKSARGRPRAAPSGRPTRETLLCGRALCWPAPCLRPITWADRTCGRTQGWLQLRNPSVRLQADHITA